VKPRLSGALLLALWLAGCAALPQLEPAAPERTAEIRAACEQAFPRMGWRMVHAIEADFPGGRKGLLIGASAIDPRDRSIEFAMMTVEGLVVLEAVHRRGETVIRRGIPPFDAPEAARGVVADIRLAFLAPVGPRTAVGLSKSGAPVCRYRTGEEEVVDVRVDPGGGWRIRRYRNRRLIRTVRAGPPDGPLPGRVDLIAHGPHAYALHLKLLEVDGLSR